MAPAWAEAAAIARKDLAGWVSQCRRNSAASLTFPEQRQVVQPSPEVHAACSHVLFPEILFLPLSFLLTEPGEVSHLMPDDGGQYVVEDAGPLLPTLQRVALGDKVDHVLSLPDSSA